MDHIIRSFVGVVAGGAAVVAAAVAAVLVAPASPATAGGWVVVSLDERPQVAPGEPTELGFTVLRHGVAPETSVDMRLVVVDDAGRRQRLPVTPDGDPGHHVATLTLDEGRYTLSLEGLFMPYDLGAIEVTAPTGGGSAWGWDVVQWGGLGAAVALGGVGLGTALRRRPHPAVA